MNIHQIDVRHWQVTDKNKEFFVELAGGELECTCPSFAIYGGCEHTAAVDRLRQTPAPAVTPPTQLAMKAANQICSLLSVSGYQPTAKQRLDFAKLIDRETGLPRLLAAEKQET